MLPKHKGIIREMLNEDISKLHKDKLNRTVMLKHKVSYEHNKRITWKQVLCWRRIDRRAHVHICKQ